MDPVMRGLFLTILCAAVSLPACKKDDPPNEPVAPQIPRPPTENSAPSLPAKPLSSVLRVGDEAVAGQLVKGFNEAVAGAWRWTNPSFSVKLGVPTPGAEKGATLRLKFTLPKQLIEQNQKVKLSAAVGDITAWKVFESEGEHVLEMAVPPAALASGTVNADFAVDKPFVPGGSDARSLGVIAQLVELAPALASVVPLGTDTYARQLLKGFYDPGPNAWRWTEPSFGVRLAVPAQAAGKGAVLRLNFTLPKALISKNPKVTVTAKVGSAKASKAFTAEGEHLLELAVPAAALEAESIDAEFTVDKPFVPGAGDDRPLGVIAQSVELVTK
jgi:hypothetical protein